MSTVNEAYTFTPDNSNALSPKRQARLEKLATRMEEARERKRLAEDVDDANVVAHEAHNIKLLQGEINLQMARAHRGLRVRRALQKLSHPFER